MSDIWNIHFNLQTGAVDGAGTDGDIYLGVGGREFSVDTRADDFEAGSSREYIFGADANVQNSSYNDPRTPQMYLEFVARFPMYVRFAPQSRDDNWKLLRAEVWFNDSFFPRWDTGDWIPFGASTGGIWMGTHAGQFVYIPQHDDGTTPKRRRKVA